MLEPSLETIITGDEFFALPATPVQRAICRAADGRPLGALANDPDVQFAFCGRGAIEALPTGRPRRVDIYSGIRTAKSLIAAGAAVCMSQRVDVSALRPGEVPRIPILSLSKDLGDVVLGHLTGTINASPILRRLLVGDPTGDTITLRHPSGIPVEITVTAGKRAGGSLVARWLAGVIFDESPRMLGSEDGAVISIDDALDACAERILEGGQIFCIGSPYAPWGEAYNSVRDYWGKPSRQRVVIKSPAPAMNPSWWTPTRVEDARVNRPRAFKTDVLAEFADAATSAFDSASVDRAFRPRHGARIISPSIGILDSSAGRGDSFVWAVAEWRIIPDQIDDYDVHQEVDPDGSVVEVLTLDPNTGMPRRRRTDVQRPFMCVHTWGAIEGKFRDSVPFDTLISRIASEFRRHGVRRAVGDAYQSWPIATMMQKQGIAFMDYAWSSRNKAEALARVKEWYRADDLAIEADPEEAAKIRAELVQLQEVVTSAGGVSIGARRGGHDDRCAIILNLGILDGLGEFRGSPTSKGAGLICHGPNGGDVYYVSES